MGLAVVMNGCDPWLLLDGHDVRSYVVVPGVSVFGSDSRGLNPSLVDFRRDSICVAEAGVAVCHSLGAPERVAYPGYDLSGRVVVSVDYVCYERDGLVQCASRLFELDRPPSVVYRLPYLGADWRLEYTDVESSSGVTYLLPRESLWNDSFPSSVGRSDPRGGWESESDGSWVCARGEASWVCRRPPPLDKIPDVGARPTSVASRVPAALQLRTSFWVTCGLFLDGIWCTDGDRDVMVYSGFAEDLQLGNENVCWVDGKRVLMCLQLDACFPPRFETYERRLAAGRAR